MADYRDPTPNDFPKDYEKSAVDERVLKRTKAVREKMYGIDTREAMAQAEEITSVVANEAKKISDETKLRQTDLEQRYNDQIAGNTDIDEVIDARRPAGGETYNTLNQRLDNQIGLNTDFRDFESDKSFMLRVHADLSEREINLKWFNPAGDGVTDDTQAFLNAIAYCAQVKARKLMIPPCSNFYKITKELEFGVEYNGLTIEGSGDLGTIKLVVPTNRGHLFGILGTSNNESDWIDGIKMSNLTVEVSYSRTDYPTGVDNAIGFSCAKNLIFENIKINKTPWKGISAQHHCKNIVFDNITAQNCFDYGIGAEYSTCENITLYNCKAYKNGKQGILVTSAGDGGYVRGVTIENCVAYENDLEGIGLNYCDNPTTRSNQAYKNKGAGLKYRRCVRTVSQSDKSVDNNLAGIYVLEGSFNVILNGDSRNNSMVDPDERGNVFFDNSPNGQLLNTIANAGIRSMTNHSENLLVSGSLLTSTDKAILRTALAEQTERIHINADGTSEVRVGSIPTLGSWKRGDKAWTTTPLAGQPPGWICVASGSPGIWRAMPSLSV